MRGGFDGCPVCLAGEKSAKRATFQISCAVILLVAMLSVAGIFVYFRVFFEIACASGDANCEIYQEPMKRKGFVRVVVDED